MSALLERPVVDLPRLSATALVLGFLTMFGGAILWGTATGGSGSLPGTGRHMWERGLLMVAIVLSALGLLLLARHLWEMAGFTVVLAGAVVYAGAGTLGLVHEVGNVSFRFEAASWVLPAYVIGAFLGQAAVGLGLAQGSGSWAAVGWVVLVWNLAWLVILLVFSPGDLYFPMLHHLVLLAVAIPLVMHRLV